MSLSRPNALFPDAAATEHRCDHDLPRATAAIRCRNCKVLVTRHIARYALISIIANERPAELTLDGPVTSKGSENVTATIERATAQVTGEQTIAIARKRFSNLSAEGILNIKLIGEPIDPDDVTIALEFLARCGKTEVPACHTHDLRRKIGRGVSTGATIAACIASGFAVHSWYGVREFGRDCLTDVRLPG
jgi:hypothetical protein